MIKGIATTGFNFNKIYADISDITIIQNGKQKGLSYQDLILKQNEIKSILLDTDNNLINLQGKDFIISGTLKGGFVNQLMGV